MKVVASMNRGDWLLLIPGDDFEAAQEADVPIVRVLWRSRKWLMRPASLNAQFKQGNWRRAELPDTELQALLGDLERVDGPGVHEPWEITAWQPPHDEAPRRTVRHSQGKRSGEISS